MQTVHILHVDARRLRRYSGNDSSFEAQRAAQLANEQAMYARQQREVARLERLVERFRAKATKARQPQSRIKALERMELIAPAHVDSPFSFHFREFPGSPDPVLALEGAAVGYDGVPVLEGVTLTIQAGARIGLLGRNGAGKTTLVKLLAGRLPALAGDRREGKNLRVGYFASTRSRSCGRSPQAQGNLPLARTSLERAQRLAQPEGYLRTFVDEGEPVRLLLLDFEHGLKSNPAARAIRCRVT